MRNNLKKKKCKTCGYFLVLLLVIAVIWIGYGVCRTDSSTRECMKAENAECQIYYLLNIDGMKGLGHSVLFLVDADGEGQVFSYNGMQYNLPQCLMGKEGIGKMKQFSLTREAVEELLETGNLQAGDYEECDNFDRALYRWITEEEYETIRREAEAYIEVGDEYERLYAETYNAEEDALSDARERMDRFLAQEDIPRYQIYHHNCDTVARELMALVDAEVTEYQVSEVRLTPNGNYKNMCCRLSESWGYMQLGEDSLVEKFLNL